MTDDEFWRMREERLVLWKRTRGLAEPAEAEGRSLTPAELSRHCNLMMAIARIDLALKKAIEHEAMLAASPLAVRELTWAEMTA